jgi:hypothetical protein
MGEALDIKFRHGRGDGGVLDDKGVLHRLSLVDQQSSVVTTLNHKSVHRIAYSGDGASLLVASETGRILVLDADDPAGRSSVTVPELRLISPLTVFGDLLIVPSSDRLLLVNVRTATYVPTPFLGEHLSSASADWSTRSCIQQRHVAGTFRYDQPIAHRRKRHPFHAFTQDRFSNRRSSVGSPSADMSVAARGDNVAA